MKIFAFVVLMAPLAAFAQKKSALSTPAIPNEKRYDLKGIVTYFFNGNQGYKADVGATAYIIKDGVLQKDSLDAGAAEAYRSANVIYSLSSGADNKAMLPDEQTPQQRYRDSKARLARLKRRLETNPNASRVTADGQGVFLKKLHPGTYWVLITSGNRTPSASMQRVILKDDDVEVSAKFEAD